LEWIVSLPPRRMAGLDGEAGHVDGHVRAGFVDHAQHAERDALAPEVQTARSRGYVVAFADRIREIDHLAQVGGDAVEPGGGERQPVDQAFGEAGGFGRRHILGVGGEDRRAVLGEDRGQFRERPVLLKRRRLGHDPRCGAGAFSELGHIHGHDNLPIRG
jgi:hypothetical protein